jgi:hypothetical protein
MNQTKLDPEPARQLSSRECAKILGGTLGCLMTMAPAEDVKAAVAWWIEHWAEAWPQFGPRGVRP